MNPESGVSCFDDVDIPTHAPEGKGINMALECSSGTGEVGAIAQIDRMGNDVTIEPSSQSVGHATGEHRYGRCYWGQYSWACVDPKLGPSLGAMSNAKGDQ